MRAFGKSNGGGRRGAQRCFAPLPAVVMTITSTRRATMLDISCTGARLKGSQLPPPGAVAELKIEAIRVFGTVAWSANSECGIAFDEPLTPFEIEGLRRRAGLPSLASLTVDERLAVENWLLGVSR